MHESNLQVPKSRPRRMRHEEWKEPCGGQVGPSQGGSTLCLSRRRRPERRTEIGASPPLPASSLRRILLSLGACWGYYTLQRAKGRSSPTANWPGSIHLSNAGRKGGRSNCAILWWSHVRNSNGKISRNPNMANSWWFKCSVLSFLLLSVFIGVTLSGKSNLLSSPSPFLRQVWNQ